jgi:hypothetical protein
VRLLAEKAEPGSAIADYHDAEDRQDDVEDYIHAERLLLRGGRGKAGFWPSPDALPRFEEGCVPKSTMASGWGIFHPVWCLTGRSQDLQ